MYLVWVTKPPFWSYSGSKWGHRPKIGCVTKNKRCPKSQTPFYFSSERPEIELTWTHRPGVQVDSILGQKLSLVLDTAIVLQQISKRWSTLAARNSTLNTLYPPLANIFWTLWTMDWVIRFLGYFWYFMRSGAKIILAKSAFSKFECFGWFLCIESICMS